MTYLLHYPHQSSGAEFLACRSRAFLGDDMGLGKTITAILAADMVGATRVVVVCPASVKMVWRHEFKKWSVLQPNVLIFSYNELVSNPDRRFEAIAHLPEVLILDEAHYLKSPWSKRTGVCYEHLIRHADMTWCLSGTPAPKDPSDLWTHCKYIGGEAMGYQEWAEYFCHLGPSDYSAFRVYGLKREKIPELRARLAPWYLRRTSDILDLPELRWGELPVESKRAIRTLKKSLINMKEERDGYTQLSRIVRTASDEEVLEALERSPYTATIQRLTALAKLPALLEEVHRQMEDGLEKVVLFAWHREVIYAIEEYFAGTGINTVSLHGGTSESDKEAAVYKFQDRASCRVFIGQTLAAGTGLTLTASDRAIFCEPDWTPANMSQAAKRIHRIGQEKSCLVQVASLVGSFDEVVNRVLMRRAQTIAELEEQR